jgi:hypothetical protein
MGGCFLDKQSKAKEGRRDRAASACGGGSDSTRGCACPGFYAVSSRWRCAARHRVDRCPMGDGFSLSLARASSSPTTTGRLGGARSNGAAAAAVLVPEHISFWSPC